MTSIYLASLLALAATPDESLFQQNVRTTEPRTAEEQAAMFHVPPGFRVELVAAEPDIQKPMNLAFDAHGRLWVSGSVEYPYAAEETGRDAIKVLEDTNGDGRADTITTFADDLNIPIGLYPYRDGVVAYSISSIDFFQDTDGDLHADNRTTLYGPLDRPVDTHGMQNAFRRGPDGLLYINHGFSNRTTIRGSDGSEITLHSGNTYRVRLDGSHVEQYTWGQVNPFGSAWTEWGDLVTADCHSKPLTLLLRGGYYSSFGKPHDGLGFAPELMSHHHGSTGLAGVAYYADGRWPDEYRHNLFVGNVVTSRVHRDELVFEGATPSAVERPEFLRCDDPWFRPVDLRFGPDGALYIADFYNRIIGHYEVPLEHPGRDRTRGRIWRVVYEGANDAAPSNSTPQSLADADTAGLLEAFGDPNWTRWEMTLDQLSDRVGPVDLDLVRAAAQLPDGAASDVNDDSRSWQRRTGARWALFRFKALNDDELAVAVTDPHPIARAHGFRMMAEFPELDDICRQRIMAGLDDPHPQVQLAAIDAAGQHPDGSQLAQLLTIADKAINSDPMLLHAARLALRNVLRMPLQETDAAAARTASQQKLLAEIALAVPQAHAATLVIDYLEHGNPSDDQMSAMLQHAVQYAPPREANRLVAMVQQKCATNLPLQVKLFRVMRDANPESEGELTTLLNAWGRRLLTDMLTPPTKRAPVWQITQGAAPWSYEDRTTHDGNVLPFLSSLPGGEQALSRLVSPSFKVPATLSFELCGHRGDPGQVHQPPGDRTPEMDETLADNYVQLRLLSNGQVVRRAYAPRNDRAIRVEWQLNDYEGQPAILEIVDQINAPAYAWLAMARLEPNVAPFPITPPSTVADWQILIAELADDLAAKDAAETLKEWITSGASWNARAVAAAVWGKLTEAPQGQTVAAILTVEQLPSDLRRNLAQAFVTADAARVVTLQSDAFRALPENAQLPIAQTLATTSEGAARLVAMVQQGVASSRLLLRPEIMNQIRIVGSQSDYDTAHEIAARVPTEDPRIAELARATLADVKQHSGDHKAGEALFTKHCRVCHQVGQQGALVGPQLDGIGNRGLDRLVEDVLTPYRNVDQAFRTTIVTLDDGRVLSGLLREERDDAWLIVDNQGKELRIDVASIEESQQSPLSIMPDNFATTLTDAERRDLFGYLNGLRADRSIE